jgi:hypothetical protein
MTMIFAAVHESVVVKGFGALPRERVRCVLGMFSSLEVKVLYPT